MASSLIARFEDQVERRPNSVAITDGERQFTYLQLNRWADCVAIDLQRAGVRPGQLVGVSLRRNASVVAGILGTLKLGSGYVPIDPTYPRERIDFMLSDAQVGVVLTDGSCPGLDGVTVREVPMRDFASCREPEEVRGRGSADTTAYVIYTSGSTGAPKGVPVTNGNVLALFRGVFGLFSFGPSDTWTLFHSPSFDLSVWETWGALLYGGRLVCVSDLERVHGRSFTRLIVRESVTVVTMVPSVFRHLGQDASLLTAPGLRYLIFAGEQLDIHFLRHWMDEVPVDIQPAVVNMYGITETTIHATFRMVTRRDVWRDGVGTLIGPALPHLRMVLLDEEHQRVADGKDGEIYIAGTGVVRGYLNRPRETEQRFVTLAAARGEARRFFRSGDVALWSDPDSSFIYLGRVDDQLKVRGVRIEPGEIEHAVRRIAGVVDAVAGVQRDPVHGDRLCLFVASPNPALNSPESIRKTLRAYLPEYLVPSVVHVLDELQSLPSGKVNRRVYRTGALGAERRVTEKVMGQE